MNESEEFAKLLEGNKRFVAGRTITNDLQKMRNDTVQGQKPFATVLTCSDSRVPPEHIFDVGIGEIFVIRTAGNVVDKIALGSIEYAAEHLNVPLLVVLGHESCGAVKATWGAVEKNENVHGNIGAIVEKITKSVSNAKSQGKDVECATDENVKAQINAILNESEPCKKLYDEGKLKIIGAKYFLSSGEVKGL
ncbi:carbonic anhydrase [Candidatus Micrarchaeota archaeon]|nr:carbonic anhydrase [Candidatus Micrarchaeota archaeon]